ncbi:uncharacterized protein HD556DRAFT_1303095 [Suillus plorans]|uniref:Uncharacterized protein n=1 Tax=Suillus plorans TaxID=116603 RepID=A0A9P7DYV8_9AGAM|nr:uncharacterized protein HD556DRAFT_1303095 [Suillus plorans]KAG1806686.1 hypothetical protein HD556DRAFT_1303095 [Suillus plorans]
MHVVFGRMVLETSYDSMFQALGNEIDDLSWVLLTEFLNQPTSTSVLLALFEYDFYTFLSESLHSVMAFGGHFDLGARLSAVWGIKRMSVLFAIIFGNDALQAHQDQASTRKPDVIFFPYRMSSWTIKDRGKHRLTDATELFKTQLLRIDVLASLKFKRRATGFLLSPYTVKYYSYQAQRVEPPVSDNSAAAVSDPSQTYAWLNMKFR